LFYLLFVGERSPGVGQIRRERICTARSAARQTGGADA